MIPIRFHPEADAEMMSAAKFYKTQQKDLGKHFLASVQDALNRIQAILSYIKKSKLAFVAV